MFDNVKNRFKDVFASLGKKPTINEKDLDVVLREIRMILLEADVSLELTKIILSQLKTELLGQEIYKTISPKAVISKALYDTLFDIVNTSEEESSIYTKGFATYMLVGLQGTGKTTTCGKLALFLQKNYDKKFLLVSLDFNRPAAYEQLQSICNSNNLEFFPYQEKNLTSVIENAKNFALNNNFNGVIFDTAGRLSLDVELMQEMQNIHALAKPKETLLVLDSMAGQISLNVAKMFKEKVPLTGIIISKADADSRGGAVLSCKYVTEVPIKFMGVGEKINNLEIFYPKRFIDRLLDQGDIISLVEKFNEIEEDEVLKLQERMEKGIWTLDDLKKQLKQMEKLGGMSSILSMIPGLSGLQDKVNKNPNMQNMMKKNIAIIDSMTRIERKTPKVLNYSRKQRIAKGSGTTLQNINALLKQYEEMAKMMKKFSGKGGLSNMANIQDLMKNLKP